MAFCPFESHAQSRPKIVIGYASMSSVATTLWVAQEKGKPPLIAHAVITKSYDIRRGYPTVSLCELYVAPTHRRTGLARKMMSAIAKRAR